MNYEHGLNSKGRLSYRLYCFLYWLVHFQSMVNLVSSLVPPIVVAIMAILCGNVITQSSSAILRSDGQVVLAVFSVFLESSSAINCQTCLALMCHLQESHPSRLACRIRFFLANRHFGNPLTAVQCAVSSII